MAGHELHAHHTHAGLLREAGQVSSAGLGLEASPGFLLISLESVSFTQPAEQEKIKQKVERCPLMEGPCQVCFQLGGQNERGDRKGAASMGDRYEKVRPRSCLSGIVTCVCVRREGGSNGQKNQNMDTAAPL